jgi:hypothetical protein
MPQWHQSLTRRWIRGRSIARSTSNQHSAISQTKKHFQDVKQISRRKAGFLRGSRPARRQINHVWHRPRPSSLAHRSCPANDRFLPRAYSPVADPAVLGKSTLCSYCTHSHASLVFFKQQHVARPHPQRLADGKGHGNSTLRRNLRLLLQGSFLTIVTQLCRFYLTREM